jgi:hypothetical protein
MKTVCYESYTFMEALKLNWIPYLISLIVGIGIYIWLKKQDRGCWG